jgi:antitoxin ParD1/3/4
MAMATMNISLPEQMKEWVEAQTADGRYSNSSDYVRDLIRKEQIKAEKIAHLQGLITEGLESGISTKSFDEIWKSAQEKAVKRNALRA